jgi:DNA polymerase IV
MIWGVGKAFADKLAADGIRSIGQLQRMEEGVLMARYGSMGQRLYRLSRGRDERVVEPREAAKSVSAETTFNSDLGRPDDLVPVLRSLSETVAHRLKASGIAGQTVVLKLKTADFRIRTRNRRLDDPTRYADRIFRTGLSLLEKEMDGTKFRLLGIGVSDLTDLARADMPDLVDPLAGRRAVAESAMDSVRAKFGRASVETGYTFGRGNRGRPERDDA